MTAGSCRAENGYILTVLLGAPMTGVALYATTHEVTAVPPGKDLTNRLVVCL